MKNKSPIKIVIFGPDNSGKTTLAETLVKELKGKDFHYSHSPGPVSVEEMCNYINHHLHSNQNIIFDRFPVIEEMVCGRILRGKDKFDSCREDSIAFLKRVDLFIFCDPGIETITNWGTREQMEGVKENIISLYRGYRKLSENLSEIGVNIMLYNWQNSKEEIEKIKERVKEL